MGWVAAVAPALTTAAPYATAALGVAQFQQQGAAGAYNKAIADRNVVVNIPILSPDLSNPKNTE